MVFIHSFTHSFCGCVLSGYSGPDGRVAADLGGAGAAAPDPVKLTVCWNTLEHLL